MGRDRPRGGKPPSHPPSPTERRAAVEERRVRAAEEPLDVRLRSREVYPMLDVRNPLHGTEYRVLLPEFPEPGSALCTCTDFARRGLGTCKHIEAGFAWLTAHPEAPALGPTQEPTPSARALWKEIDRRLAGRTGHRAPPSLALRRPGAALFERPRRRARGSG